MTTPATHPTIAPPPDALADHARRASSPLEHTPEHARWVATEALRLCAAWEEGSDPEQYVDGHRLSLAVDTVIQAYAIAKGKLR